MPATAKSSQNDDARTLEQAIRHRINALSYLPTTAAVAMRFIELGKDPEADPHEYSTVIAADSALSTKVLAMANSSWFGVRNKVTKVPVAVNLLGLGTVRTLAISYCMAGLHSELRLTAEESGWFWESSLCKAVAAKVFAGRIDPKLADEAFAMGLFQDFALPVMYAAGKKPLLALLRDPETDWRTQIVREREQFRLDHAEIGRILAQKLELPEVFVDAVAFHHDRANLGEMLEKPALADANHIAALFPHLLNTWNRSDVDELREFLAAKRLEIESFLASVQVEYDSLLRYFEDGANSEVRLRALVESAAKEAADNTTLLVQKVSSLMHQAAGQDVDKMLLTQRQSELESSAGRDELTGVLNRSGFNTQAKKRLADGARYGLSFAIVYLDLDKFKNVNDSLGHDAGDRALQRAAKLMLDAVQPRDLVGRMGGDEFVMLIQDCSQRDAESSIDRLVSAMPAEPIGRDDRQTRVSVSAGLLFVDPAASPPDLHDLISQADKLMYDAKHAGGNRRVSAPRSLKAG